MNQSNAAEAEKRISVKGVYRTFGRKVILNNITFEVEPGTCAVVMGSSGCGKSTLFKLLTGVDSPQKGSITMLGKNLARLPYMELMDLRKRMGVLFQGGALWRDILVWENVARPIEEHVPDLSPETVRIMSDLFLHMVDMRKHAGKHPSILSGGQRKRVGLARAMALHPEVLICDEPTSGLDPIMAREVNRLIRNLSEKLSMTCVVISHEIEGAFDIVEPGAEGGKSDKPSRPGKIILLKPAAKEEGDDWEGTRIYAQGTAEEIRKLGAETVRKDGAEELKYPYISKFFGKHIHVPPLDSKQGKG